MSASLPDSHKNNGEPYRSSTDVPSSSLSIVPTVAVGQLSGGTVVVQPHQEEDVREQPPSFVHCESQGPFLIDGNTKSPQSAATVNRTLNLNLGMKWLSPERNKLLLWIIRFLNNILVSWWERFAFDGWNAIPLSWRRKLFIALWKVYFPLHKILLGRRTGIHRAASLEYHALTTIMHWGRYFPVSVERMRFSLSQLGIWCSEPFQAPHVETIQEDQTETGVLAGIDPLLIPECQRKFCTVRGKWIYRNGPQQPTDWTIFWVYGGAFLAGDVEGNLAKADIISRKTSMDVFLIHYRLVPEYEADDIIWDVALGYKWLCERRRTNPNKIILFGISSGAAVCVRLLQYMAEKKRGETLLPPYFGPVVNPNAMPSGALLMGPFADFTEPTGSLVHYSKHDLIVNQRVLEIGLPFLDTHVPSRKEYSPVHRRFDGLPPLCVIVSQHEAVYDMSVDLVNKARAAGVSVTVAAWKYMCHVFSFLDAFIPEGRQSLDFSCSWIMYIQHQQQQQQKQ